LGKSTLSVPKILLEINKKQFIEIQLEYLLKMGASKFLYLTGHLNKSIEKKIIELRKVYPDLDLDYLWEGGQALGTGGAVKNAFNHTNYKDAFLTYGDNYLNFNFYKFYEFCNKSNAKAAMTVFKNSNLYDRSNVDYSDNLVKNYSKVEDKNYHYIDYGFSFISRNYFLELCSSENKFDLSDILAKASNQGKLLGYKVYKRFYEIGSPKGLEEFKANLK